MASASPVQQGNVLTLLPETFVVLKCAPEEHIGILKSIPENFPQKYSFFSVSLTPEECSVITPANSLVELMPQRSTDVDRIKSGPTMEITNDWHCFKVEGPLDFGLVGILHRILDPLKKASISVLAVGTYNTDYFLVKGEKLEEAQKVLREVGFQVNA